MYENRREKFIFDKKFFGPTYKLNDFVLVHSPILKPGQTRKLKSHWSGPYIITKVINDVNLLFAIQILEKVRLSITIE